MTAETLEPMFVEFVLTWLGPVGFSAIVAFIIWLVQHNIALMNLGKLVGKHDSAIDKMIEEHNGVLMTIQTMQVAQDHILEKAKAAEDHITEHNAEAEEWKRRIVANEIRLAAIENGKAKT